MWKAIKTSQFFANVYINALDHFVKHTLKASQYVRYMDDFVLLANSREELQGFKVRIEKFLQSELRFKLKEDVVLQPRNCDTHYLDYLFFAHYQWVRPHAVRHCHCKLSQWYERHKRFLLADRVTHLQFAHLQAQLNIYCRYFVHSDSFRLQPTVFVTYSCLADYYELQTNGALQVSMPARWQTRRKQALLRHSA